MCIILINGILLWPKRKHTKIGSHEPLQLLFVKSMQEIYEMNVLGFLTCILCPKPQLILQLANTQQISTNMTPVIFIALD